MVVKLLFDGDPHIHREIKTATYAVFVSVDRWIVGSVILVITPQNWTQTASLMTPRVSLHV